MKVYEMIQELCGFDAEAEVEFYVKGQVDKNAIVDLNGEEEQIVTVDFDESCYYEEIKNEKNPYTRKTDAVIVISF